MSTKDRGQDTANQTDQLRDFCVKQDWTIVREYIDHVSGKTADKRPQFQAMLAAASRHEFDLVFFWSLDRFSREGVLPTLKHLELLTSYGIEWKSYTEQYFDSCGTFRDAAISIVATLAEQERLKISERTIAGLQRVQKHGSKSGKPCGRPRVVVGRERVLKLLRAGESLKRYR